jgi:hypothetical protein
MNRKELKKALLNDLLVNLTQIGFDKKISGQTFWKKIDYGKVGVHLSFINHYDDFDITLNFCIRADVAEDLLNQINEYMKPKDRKDTATLGVEFGNLTMGKQKRWTIVTEDDLNFVVKDIYEKVVNEGNEFFNRFPNLESIFQLSIKEDSPSSLFIPINYVRAIYAVALAKKLGDPNLGEIVINKENFLKQKNDEFGLDKLKEFLVILKNI